MCLKAPPNKLIPATVFFTMSITNMLVIAGNKSDIDKPVYFKDFSRTFTNAKDDLSIERKPVFPKSNQYYDISEAYSPNQQLNKFFLDTRYRKKRKVTVKVEKRNSTSKKQDHSTKSNVKSTTTEATTTEKEYVEIITTTASSYETTKTEAHENLITEVHENVITEAQFSKNEMDSINSGIEVDDIIVKFGMPCRKQVSEACWLERQVGDTITLNINISGLIDMSLISIRWKKLYQLRERRAQMSMSIELDRLPWNMVLGSGNRELRLNPVSNSDIDPNSLSAKVFFKDVRNNNQPYQLIKELLFRIDIPPIDVGEVYYGEEITIYLENFITLPENGNLVIEWAMEKPDNKKESLASNIKESASGRSIVIKELKKDQLGVISSVLYSSNGITIAKRRFSIKRLVVIANRRSLHRRNNRKRRLSKEYLKKCPFGNRDKSKRLARYMMPISRKKRYRMDFISAVKRCRRWGNRHGLHHRYTRWAIFDEFDTTLDPRLMPVEKLIALSEESDGTLDDIIPHEVHFVKPIISFGTDSILENVRTANFQPNCSNDLDCGIGAYCIVPRGQPLDELNDEKNGYCYCRPEYYGDGFKCRKIPMDNHRDKRIKKSVPKIAPVSADLFYSDKESTHKKNNAPITELQTEFQLLESEAESPKIMEYEEEESYLMSTCVDKKDCSPHALCHQYGKNHPFCKCVNGFRGNGIFCWEIMDYVPVDILDIDMSDS